MANPMAIEGRPLLDLVYNAANAGKRSAQTEGIDIAGYKTLRMGMGPQSAAVMVRGQLLLLCNTTRPVAPFPGAM